MQQEFFGRGVSAEIIKPLTSLGVNRLLLVTGKKIVFDLWCAGLF